MSKSLNPALSAFLSLLAATLAAAIFLAWIGSSTTYGGSALAFTGPDPSSPDISSWSPPILVSGETQYDNAAHLSAAPLDGSAQVIWTRSANNSAQIVLAVNHNQGGAFDPPLAFDSDGDTLIDVVGAAHDSASHTHILSWKYSGTTLCDYYKQFDKNGDIVASEAVPGSCNVSTPRKIGAIAVDASRNVYILLGRSNVPGSMLFWERTSAGTWTIQAEALPAGCSPADPSLTVTTQGKVMAAWRDCGVGNQGTDIFTGLRTAPSTWQVEDISATCCSDCPNVSGAYLPKLAADPTGGIRAAWADGRCSNVPNTDIYYREWTSSAGWDSHPLVRVVNNSGSSYNPSIVVDNAGEAYITWDDDTSSPTGYYRVFFSHGHGTVFTAPVAPFNASFPTSWQKDNSLDYAHNAIHVAFSSNRDDPNKDPYYSYAVTTLPPTPTPVPPPCPGHRFTDVCPGTYYYTAVANLVSADVISGYSTSPPCPASSWIPCFLPGRTATRGQVAKIITLGAGLTINTSGGPHFTDVPTSNPFYQYIETMYHNGIIGGYTTGCLSGSPCFKPGNNVTRGQLSKMAALAFGFNEPVSGQTFQDVPSSNTFYQYIERLTSRSIIGGYPCGTPPAGACVHPGNKPYFLPNNNITRAQLTKIIDLCRQ